MSQENDAVQEEAQIPKKLSKLNKSVDHLPDLLAKLIARLDPVLHRPDPPEEAKNVKESIDEPLVPLAGIIAEITTKLDHSLANLRDIIRRVEL